MYGLDILSFFFNLVLHIAGAVFLHLLLQPRWNRRASLPAYILISYSIALFVYAWCLNAPASLPIRGLAFPLTYVLLSIVFFKGGFIKKVFAVGAYLLANIACEIIGGMFGIIMYDSPIGMYEQSKYVLGLIMLCYIALLFLLLYAIFLLARKGFLKLNSREMLFFFLLPLSQYHMISVAIWTLGGSAGFWLYLGSALGILLCLAADIGLFQAMRSAAEKSKLEEETRQLAETMQLQYKNCEAFGEQYMQMRKLRHDVANHAYTIQALVAGEHIEEAQIYLAEWKDAIQLAIEGASK